MSLADILGDVLEDPTAPSTDKKDLFGKSIKTWMGSYPPQESYTDILRASSIAFLCPREAVLNYWRPTPNRIFTSEALFRMKIGTDLHSYFQNCVLGPMGVLFGNWLDGSGAIHENQFMPERDYAIDRIIRQRNPVYLYEEYNVYEALYRIGGHLDGLVSVDRLRWIIDNQKEIAKDIFVATKLIEDIDPGELAVLEIKSASRYGFDKLVDVKSIPSYYKMQATIYQWLKKVPRTAFLFIDRDSVRMKTLMYEGEDMFMNEAKRKARIIWEAIRDETLPESMMACKTPKDKRVKTCVHAGPCWERRFDMSEYIEKARDDQPTRLWLDLSGVSFDS